MSANILVFILAAFFLVGVIWIQKLCYPKKRSVIRTFSLCFKILLCLFLFLLGNWYYTYYVNGLSQKAAAFANENPPCLQGVVVSEVHTYDQTAYFTLREENGLKISVKIRTNLPILCGERVCLKNPECTPVNPLNHKIQATRKLMGNNTFLSATFPYEAEVIKKGIGDYSLYLGKRLRLATADCFQRLFPSDIAHFLTALISSDRSEMPEDLYQSFLSTGTVHIVVVSGMHFNYLMTFLLFLSSFVVFSHRKRLVFSAGVLSFFIIYTGATLPVLRSFFLMLAGFLGDLFYVKPQDKLKMLLTLFAAFLTATPTLIFNPSFLLTFGAALGLTACSKPLEQKLSGIPWNGVRSYLATYIAVSLMTFPVILLYFGKIPLVSLVSNFLVAPLTAPILILGIITLAIHRIPLVSTVILIILRALSTVFVQLVKILSSLPVSLKLSLKDSSFLMLMGGVTSFACYCRSVRKLKKAMWSMGAILCVVLAISLQWQTPYNSRMLITFFGASNTNSAAILTPSDKLILYGTGTDLIYGQSSAAYRDNQPIELLILTGLSNPQQVTEFLDTHPVNKIVVPQRFSDMLSNTGSVLLVEHPVCIATDGITIRLNTDGNTIFEAEFSYMGRSVSFTQNAAYLLEQSERNPNKSWIVNFSRSSHASRELEKLTLSAPIFSKKQWHPAATLYNNYSIIQADASGVRLLGSAEQER